MSCCTSNNSNNMPTYSCEVMIEYKTCLCPPSQSNTKILQLNTVDAKIEKICTNKIIIVGILHKTIVYTDVCQFINDTPNKIKQKDITFSCYIDIPNNNMNDSYKIVQNQIICNSSQVIREADGCCCEETILVDMNIIKIAVQKTTSNDGCSNMISSKFCGKEVVDCEINFPSPVKPSEASISVSVDPDNFKVKLVCCNFIAVSGYFTKIIKFADGTPTVKKVIPVHVEIPIDMCHCDNVNNISWRVSKAEACIIFSDFTCPDKHSGLYHKLKEKDLVVVEIEHVST